MENISICTARFELSQDPGITPVELRGFMAHRFTDIPEFHHHSVRSYHYPLVQYKKMGDRLAVVGVREFSSIVFRKMSDLDHIMARSKRMPVRSLSLENSSYRLVPEAGTYGFASPWLALNRENHARFSRADGGEKTAILESILVGNILSMLKGLGVFADRRITARIDEFKADDVAAHGNRFIGIRAKFETNVRLPAGLGLGKSVSKGFGILEAV